MVIRIATPDDADEMAQVNVEGWQTAYKNLLSPDHLAGLSQEARKSRWLDILLKNAASKFSFVAESEGKVIGFVNGGPERTNDPEFTGEIYAIYILSDYRRQGFGAALFQKSIDFLRAHDMNSMKVWVLRDNPYRPFYERRGGHVVGEKVINIGGTELIETAYGWETLEIVRQNP